MIRLLKTITLYPIGIYRSAGIPDHLRNTIKHIENQRFAVRIVRLAWIAYAVYVYTKGDRTGFYIALVSAVFIGYAKPKNLSDYLKE